MLNETENQFADLIGKSIERVKDTDKMITFDMGHRQLCIVPGMSIYHDYKLPFFVKSVKETDGIVTLTGLGDSLIVERTL